MSKLFSQFRLSKALRFRIDTDGAIYASISNSSGEFFVAPEVLSILSQIASSNPKLDTKKLVKNIGQQYKSILENIPSEKECDEIINDLLASGLVLNEAKKQSRSLQQDGFGDHWIQWAMISDSKRIEMYEEALKKNITKNSVVVDVGAGAGFLSAACLKNNAKKVIAIEETQIAQKIIPILKHLKLPTQKESFILHQQNSFDVELPSNVTHIVSELFGNDPFEEGVIPTLKNIAKNFSTQPVYIPEKVCVYFELIDLIDHPIKHRVLAYQANITETNFLSAAKKELQLDNISFPIALTKHNYKRVSQPIELGSLALNPPLNYSNAKQHPLCGQKKIRLNQKASCIVGLMWFRVYLTKEISISSFSGEKDCAQHWSPMAFLIKNPLAAEEEINVNYKLNELENKLSLTF